LDIPKEKRRPINLGMDSQNEWLVLDSQGTLPLHAQCDYANMVFDKS
jgi:hypothetical protein